MQFSLLAPPPADIIIRQNLLGTAGAWFSACERYRYLLWRRWVNDAEPCRWLNMTMLNPSKATHEVNDPTVHRQIVRAQDLGFGGLFVTNLHAWRATDPREIYRVADPTGQPHNGLVILEVAQASAMVICGWGNHGRYLGQGAMVRSILESAGIKLHCLRVTKAGEPEHPLYLGYGMQPIPFGGAL